MGTEAAKHKKSTTKPIPFALRDRLWEIRGIELAVWLCYYLHADRFGLAWPSVETVSRETGYSPNRVSAAKRRLVLTGWLMSAGQERKAGAKFGKKEFLVLIPSDTFGRGRMPEPCHQNGGTGG